MILRTLASLTIAITSLIFSSPAWSDAQGLRALHENDRTVARIGYRLAVANSLFCAPVEPILGFSVHSLAQYPADEQADARHVFGFDRHSLVLAVAPTSPAATAGLREGDALLAVDGTPVPASGRETGSYQTTQALLDRLEASAADGRLLLQVQRNSRPITIEFTLDLGCPTRFFVSPGEGLQSKADGTYVQISAGMVRFASEDGQIAAVLAHEFAHNILKHRARLNAAGIRRGVLGQIGRSARLVRQTEEEADRLSVYLMENAGYSPDAIIAFWTKYRSAHPLSFMAAPTHGSPSDRITTVREEFLNMNNMKAAGKRPKPAFMANEALPALR